MKGFFFPLTFLLSYLRQLNLLTFRGCTGRCTYTGVGALLTGPALLYQEIAEARALTSCDHDALNHLGLQHPISWEPSQAFRSRDMLIT